MTLVLQRQLRVLLIALLFWSNSATGEEDLAQALRRAQYLLNESVPTDADFARSTASQSAYRLAVRSFIDSDRFYDAVLRYHQRLFGVGLSQTYLEELQRDDIDNKANKFAQIQCSESADGRFRCFWSSRAEGAKHGSCPSSWEIPVKAFWYPAQTAWVCPSVTRACGPNLSRCFIVYEDENVARNTELGASEVFDSRYTVIKSLSLQSAGLATAVVVDNYPYTKILEPGLTAVDGAIANFYRQGHHFGLGKLNLPTELLENVKKINLTDTRFQLVYTGHTYESAGVLTTFGWLRRYEKNRTRANQLYERLLCRKFSSELPRVFPADPGNLRETEGCQGCHAVLDPLADFFNVWGEQNELYEGGTSAVSTTFAGQGGQYPSDIANILRSDAAFATCAVQNVWEWLMGRKFYHQESELRSGLSNYFVATNYSFRELVYAVATHPAFLEGTRSDGVVTDPLEEPALGEEPGVVERACPDDPIDYATDIEPHMDLCTPCHNASSEGRQSLDTQADFEAIAATVAGMVASGSMPPGQSGPPASGTLFEFKEAARCWVEQNQ